MERTTFMLRALPGRRDAAEAALARGSDALRARAEADGVHNFSLWGVEDLFFGYGECDGAAGDLGGVWDAILDALAGEAEPLCAPGTMERMYSDIGVVRADKSLIRHRVFATRLKPGCAGEYRRRHDALAAARGDGVSEGPDSNFTIWHGKGIIFGYCEKVRSFDHPMTEAERADTVSWETRQLEIMDWFTDDVDWITGQRHEAMRRVL